MFVFLGQIVPPITVPVAGVKNFTLPPLYDGE
jgi:hypothetical protein